jgi:3-oxoacyl-[acyl-carrier protein] reductase
MSSTLTGRTALITGASHGLGLAIAHALGAQGARVACMARASAELDGAVAELRAAGVDAIAAAANVTKAAEVDAAVAATLAAYGRLDILVLNAGTWQGAPIAETTEAQWDLLLDLNLKGAFLVMHAALPTMTAQRSGTIVGIASIGGLTGQPGSAAYAASKWGLHGLLESAALELKPSRIRVTTLFPHNINSAGKTYAPGTPERDANLEPADIASMVAWIAAAPEHVAVNQVNLWPLAAGIGVR